MARSKERLKRILEDVGSLLHLESGSYRLEPASVGSLGRVSGALRDVSPDAEQDKIELLALLPDRVDECMVAGDARLLKKALRHLF